MNLGNEQYFKLNVLFDHLERRLTMYEFLKDMYYSKSTTEDGVYLYDKQEYKEEVKLIFLDWLQDLLEIQFVNHGDVSFETNFITEEKTQELIYKEGDYYDLKIAFSPSMYFLSEDVTVRNHDGSFVPDPKGGYMYLSQTYAKQGYIFSEGNRFQLSTTKRVS